MAVLPLEIFSQLSPLITNHTLQNLNVDLISNLLNFDVYLLSL